VGGVTIEIAQPLSRSPQGREAAAQRGEAERSVGPREGAQASEDHQGGDSPLASGTDQLWGLSWRVPDADAARARLVAAGVDVSEVRPGRKPGTRVVSVKDGTCGAPTLLIEPATPT
jgi:hypothetical protein